MGMPVFRTSVDDLFAVRYRTARVSSVSPSRQSGNLRVARVGDFFLTSQPHHKLPLWPIMSEQVHRCHALSSPCLARGPGRRIVPHCPKLLSTTEAVGREFETPEEYISPKFAAGPFGSERESEARRSDRKHRWSPLFPRASSSGISSTRCTSGIRSEWNFRRNPNPDPLFLPHLHPLSVRLTAFILSSSHFSHARVLSGCHPSRSPL